MMNIVIPTPEEEALAGMPTGERSFLQSLFEFTRSARQNPNREIAQAAKRWEGTLRFKLGILRQQRQRRVVLAQIRCKSRDGSIRQLAHDAAPR